VIIRTSKTEMLETKTDREIDFTRTVVERFEAWQYKQSVKSLSLRIRYVVASFHPREMSVE
jgi:hypothetical protein